MLGARRLQNRISNALDRNDIRALFEAYAAKGM